MQTERRSKPERGERLEARLTPEQKSLFVQAADLEGRSLSDFVISSAIERARQVIAEMTAIRLGAAESQAFAAALLGAPQANAPLLKAFEHRRRLTGE
jgi:uncharacterized protein (DUF1778 family)